MPCYDGREEQELREKKKRLDRVTRLLCYVMNSIGDHGVQLCNCNQDLRNWWEEHQKFDSEREKGK